MTTKINVKLQVEAWAGFGEMNCESVQKKSRSVSMMLMHLHLKCCVCLCPHMY